MTDLLKVTLLSFLILIVALLFWGSILFYIHFNAVVLP